MQHAAVNPYESPNAAPKSPERQNNSPDDLWYRWCLWQALIAAAGFLAGYVIHLWIPIHHEQYERLGFVDVAVVFAIVAPYALSLRNSNSWSKYLAVSLSNLICSASLFFGVIAGDRVMLKRILHDSILFQIGMALIVVIAIVPAAADMMLLLYFACKRLKSAGMKVKS